MTMVNLRTLTLEDYEKIIELWKASGLPYKPEGRDSKEEIKRQMLENPEFFLGAFHHEKLVGTVIGSYDFRRKGWINRLAVHPHFRRQGIAQRLITEMEGILKRKGAVVMAVLIEKPNEASIKLFKKLGYVVHESIIYLSKRENPEV